MQGRNRTGGNQPHTLSAAAGTALSSTGKPIEFARAAASAGFSIGSFVPGTVGTSDRRASWRPAVFEPRASMASALGR
jgi:hypothetical protein